MQLRVAPVFAAVLLTACSTSSAQSARQMAPTDVVATVGSTNITMAQVDEKALQQQTQPGMKLMQALYEARRNALDDLVAQTLFDQEAKARGIDRADLIEKEITSKAPAVSEMDVATWYEANKSRVQGATLDQVRQPIRAYLTQQRMQVVRDAFLETLRLKTNVRVSLEPPRQTIATANSPSKGPANAPIELVEFSDFQCPFCYRAHPTVDQVMKAYGDRIKFVYRHYPLPNHPNARPAAEASACAGEQGKFWAYHDRLFATQSRLSDVDLKQDAAELGLDAAKFNSCFDSHKYKAAVDADQHDGEEAGVNGTPAFFINGRLISGAQPYEVFKKMIDEELALKGKS
ncbi:MAG TPA: thioredoxin domain-containing protein [Vicinamibacterales bacterium]|nr:thioredoxin domain-containing protein [Vicinamibacterales bacterium]